MKSLLSSSNIKSYWKIKFIELKVSLRAANRTWRLFRRHRLGLLGLILIGIFGLMVPAQPLLLNTVWDRRRYDPYVGFDIAVEANPAPPSLDHLLGTDGMGRDIFSQLLYGSRNSFRVGIGAAIVAVFLSTLIGGLAGYMGGYFESILMGISDVFILMPALMVLLILGLVFRLDWYHIALIYGILVGVGKHATVVKSFTMSIKTKPFIEAARIAGGGHFHILRKHIFPSLAPLGLVHAVMTVVGAVLTESLLAYFSRTQEYMSWGAMIWIGQRTFRWYNLQGTWSTIVPPALSIMLFCSAFYFVGRALDDILNPRLRNR